MATSALAVQNWFETTLSGGINASDTDIGLNSVPTGTEGYLIIEPDGTTTREVIYYTSKTSNSVVLTSAANGRGVDGTTAQSHSAGATVRMQITSGYWNALQDGTGLSTSAITTDKIADGAVTPAKLLTGTGSSWAWQSWTPSWTNVTISSSTVVAKYGQIGKTVHGVINVTAAGSFAVSSTIIFSLPPVNISSSYTAREPIGHCHVYDSSTGAYYMGQVWRNSATTAELLIMKTDSTYGTANGMNSTLPMVWANGDSISATFTYEAA